MTTEERYEEYRKKLQALEEQQEDNLREFKHMKEQEEEFHYLKRDLHEFFGDMDEWASGENSRLFDMIEEDTRLSANEEEEKLLDQLEQLEEEARMLRDQEEDCRYEYQRQMSDTEEENGLQN